MPVLDAQHFLAIGLVAAALAPQIGRLEGGHQQLDGAGAILLLADDGADFLQDAKAERQKGINPGRLLPDHAGAQHQPVRDDLGLFRDFTQNRQEVAGKAHEILIAISLRDGPRSEAASAPEIQEAAPQTRSGSSRKRGRTPFDGRIENFCGRRGGNMMTIAVRSTTNVARTRRGDLLAAIGKAVQVSGG